MQINSDRAIDALNSISPDIGHDEWFRLGAAAHDAGVPFEAFDQWSSAGRTYDPRACRDMWHSIAPDKGITARTLFKLAAEHGWRIGAGKPQQRAIQAPTKAQEPPRTAARGIDPAEAWSRYEPATYAHPYIMGKQAAGVPLEGVRVVPADDRLTIQGEPMAGALVVPVMRQDGTISSL